jgi:hypothetical protein
MFWCWKAHSFFYYEILHEKPAITTYEKKRNGIEKRAGEKLLLLERRKTAFAASCWVYKQKGQKRRIWF